MESPTELYNRPPTKAGKFQFYSTGSPDIFLKGIEVDLEMTYNREQCKNYLKDKLQEKIGKLDNYDLLVYLSGGIPFLGGTLSDIYTSDAGANVKPYIYGILTRPIPEYKLNESYLELCNVSDETRKLLLSPICESTENGLIDISCLLSYLNHEGVLWDKFLKNIAAVTHFAPLITSLNRICERNDVTGRDIITVTSSLHTYFTSLLRPIQPPHKVFNFALRLCNYIINVNNDNSDFPILCFELRKADRSVEFMVKLKQPKVVYFWECDKDKEYVYYNLEPLDLTSNIDLDDENSFLSFTPIAPLSIRVATGCSIVKGKDHNYLYISQSSLKGAANMNKVDIIDPICGFADSIDLEEFARLQENTTETNPSCLIDQDRVKQVIFVCFDMSESMSWGLSGSTEKVTNETQTRTIIATQYLTSFANKTYGYRIPCIQGLIRFNHKIELSCSLSPLVPDFEEKGLKDMNPTSTTHLWDALSFACDELVKFTTSSNGNKKFKNAVNRILVISDGEDYQSKTSLLDVTKKMMKNKIIVDCVLVSRREQCKELVTLCHITGGLAFNPQDTKEGLLLFEKSAFLNYDERCIISNPLINGDTKSKPRFLKADSLTEEFLQKAVSQAQFDKEVKNKTYERAISETKLATPRNVCSRNMNSKIHLPRRRRILRELHYAALVMDPSQKTSYKDSVIVLPFYSSLDVWQVFLKGMENTPYEGKWFNLFVTFPPLYPLEPPIFRFIHVPYHLNISSEGRICLDSLEKGYLPARHVIDIILQINEIFVVPRIETPVQIEILETFMQDRELYEEKARESAQKVGRNDYKDFLPKNVIIENNVDDNFKPVFEVNNAPDYMVSQISGRVIRDPVRASSGVWYERKELLQLINTNRNPVCVITGLTLTDKAEDLTVFDCDNIKEFDDD